MSKIAMRFKSFHELRAQFSERFRSNGGYEGFTDPELFSELRDQYMKNRLRIRELEDKPLLSNEERRERDNAIRLCGDWGRIMREAAQLAVEKIFVVVAQARLPKEHFMRIMNESREIWRDNGYADGLPIPDRQRKKSISKMKRKGTWDKFREDHPTIAP